MIRHNLPLLESYNRTINKVIKSYVVHPTFFIYRHDVLEVEGVILRSFEKTKVGSVTEGSFWSFFECVDLIQSRTFEVTRPWLLLQIDTIPPRFKEVISRKKIE